MKGGGLGGWEPGEWTDDTQMAICIAEETATGTVDPVRVAGRFLDWYRSGPVDVGVQTSTVLSQSANAAAVAASATNYFKSHPDRSAANGSFMRTAPLALASLGDDKGLVELAMSVSALTHADPVAGEACALCASLSTGPFGREGWMELETASSCCQSNDAATGRNGSRRWRPALH
jgi:ADP-ribosylglycohydrolase